MASDPAATDDGDAGSRVDDAVVEVDAETSTEALAVASDPVLAHEIVGALANIVGFAQVLPDMTDLDDRAAWVVSRIEQNAADALAQLRDAASVTDAPSID